MRSRSPAAAAPGRARRPAPWSPNVWEASARDVSISVPQQFHQDRDRGLGLRPQLAEGQGLGCLADGRVPIPKPFREVGMAALAGWHDLPQGPHGEFPDPRVLTPEAFRRGQDMASAAMVPKVWPASTAT